MFNQEKEHSFYRSVVWAQALAAVIQQARLYLHSFIFTLHIYYCSSFNANICLGIVMFIEKLWV